MIYPKNYFIIDDDWTIYQNFKITNISLWWKSLEELWIDIDDLYELIEKTIKEQWFIYFENN